MAKDRMDEGLEIDISAERHRAEHEARLDEKMEVMQLEYEARIAEMERKAYEREFYHALERGIDRLGGRNYKTVCSLLPLSELSVSEDGEIDGLLEAVERLKESDGYLFYSEDAPKAVIGNVGIFPRRTAVGKANPWAKEGYNLTEQGRMLREEPERARRMMMQAGVMGMK
jgi:hypothetical protein